MSHNQGAMKEHIVELIVDTIMLHGIRIHRDSANHAHTDGPFEFIVLVIVLKGIYIHYDSAKYHSFQTVAKT